MAFVDPQRVVHLEPGDGEHVPAGGDFRCDDLVGAVADEDQVGGVDLLQRRQELREVRDPPARPGVVTRPSDGIRDASSSRQRSGGVVLTKMVVRRNPLPGLWAGLPAQRARREARSWISPQSSLIPSVAAASTVSNDAARAPPSV